MPGVVLLEFLAGYVPLGPWNPLPVPELVERNFATLLDETPQVPRPLPIVE